MKKINLIAISAAMAGVFASGIVSAAVTANVGAATNYLWRGTSLSNDAANVYGGVDYSNDSGAYAGLWQSNEGATGSPETDVYFGYSGEMSGLTYDVGYLAYMYLQNDTSDYAEVYFSAGYDFFEFFYANSGDIQVGTGEGSDYMSLTFSYDKFSFVYGDYTFEDAANDYTHFDLGVALTDELSLTYSKNDIAGDDNGRIVIGYSLEFDVK